MAWEERIELNPDVLAGKPVVKGNAAGRGVCRRTAGRRLVRRRRPAGVPRPHTRGCPGLPATRTTATSGAGSTPLPRRFLADENLARDAPSMPAGRRSLYCRTASMWASGARAGRRSSCPTEISVAPISRQRWAWDRQRSGLPRGDGTAPIAAGCGAEAEIVRRASRVAEVAADAIGLGGGLRGGRRDGEPAVADAGGAFELGLGAAPEPDGDGPPRARVDAGPGDGVELALEVDDRLVQRRRIRATCSS